jgi:predicted PurR-regulated permease PerM
MPENKDPSTAATLRGALLIILACFVVWVLSDLLLVVFAAILLATLLRGAALALARVTRLPTPISLLLVAVAVIAVFAGLAYLVGPRLIDEGERLGMTATLIVLA